MSVSRRSESAAFAVSEPEMLELLRMMDTVRDTRVSRDRRKHIRHAYVCRGAPIQVVQPGGGTTEKLAIVRDLASGGASLLYPGYLHKGSAVQIELRKRQGGTELVSGNVANCRHVHAVWHAVGIKFKDVIFPQLFLNQQTRTGFGESDSVKIDVSRLKGSILLVDDQSMDRSLFVHFLKGSGLRVTEAASSEEATALVERSLVTNLKEKDPQAVDPFDLIVCDLNLGDVAGETVIARIREKGYRGPLLVMTAETAPDRIAGAIAAGGSATFQKPYSAEKLYAAIAAQLKDGCVSIDDPLYSPLCADPQTRIMVEKYVAQVRASAAELRRWVSEDNLAKVRVICQSLKGTGVGYGFALLTDVATAAQASLDASCSVGESIAELHRLDATCSRLTAAQAPLKSSSRS